jgi:signal transduction histidine kinase
VSTGVTAEGSVSIADHDPGIEAADRPHIFERFWRGRDVRRPGAGLDLAIVAEIAKAHRAQIQVSGAPGGGTKRSAMPG